MHSVESRDATILGLKLNCVPNLLANCKIDIWINVQLFLDFYSTSSLVMLQFRYIYAIAILLSLYAINIIYVSTQFV